MENLRRKIGLFICCAVLSLLPSASLKADAQPQEPQLETLGTQMHISLADLRQLSMSLTEELEQQSKRAEALQTQLTELTASSQNMNEQLLSSETKLTISESKSKSKTKVIAVETSLIALHLIAYVVMMVLMSKGIKLPYPLAGAL